MKLREWSVATTFLLVAIGLQPPATAATHRSPKLTVSPTKLAAATKCDRSLSTGKARRAVLLVHGTGATPEEAWAWNYEIALRKVGYGVCTVTLPERAFANLATSAQYVAYAARVAYRRSAMPIAIIGHSQGGLLSVWVARFWPDIARNTSDVISLAGPLRGTALASSLCLLGSCAEVAWQQRRGSDFVNALNKAPYPPHVAHTSIGTLQDEIVFPQPEASTLGRGSTVMVQDLCPGRVVDHGLLLADAVAYRLVLDALRHRGPARPARVDRAVCSQTTLPGTDLSASLGFAQTIVALSLGLLNVTRWLAAEPPVPAYAR
jgi:triacylglycerol lipase